MRALPTFEKAIPAMCEYIEALIICDELELAEKLLTVGMPANYRGNPPEAVKHLHEALSHYLMVAEDYQTVPDDEELVRMDRSEYVIDKVPRGSLIYETVKKSNAEGKTPHLADMGPGEFWIPMGLIAKGCKFTYHASLYHRKAMEKALPFIESYLREPSPTYTEPTIFICNEVIEHLRNPWEIRQQCFRMIGSRPDEVHLSTPKGCYDEHTNWRTEPRRGAHLRTYTTSEFISLAAQMFPNYNWAYCDSDVMSLVGKKP